MCTCRYVLKPKQSEKPEVESDQPDQPTTAGEPPPAKRRKKLRGQNKHRPRAAKVNHSDLLCPSLYEGQSSSRTCQFGEKCRYSHSPTEFLAKKPPDIGESCYLFTTLGRCPYGLACRYGNSHMTPDGENIINNDLFDSNRVETTRNIISKTLQEKLRKKKVDLPKSESFLCDFSRQIDGKKEEKRETQTDTLQTEVEGRVGEGGVTDGDDPQGEAKITECDDAGMQAKITECDDAGMQAKITECDDAGIQGFTEPNEAVTGCSSEPQRTVVTTGVVTDEDLIKLRGNEKKTVIVTCVHVHARSTFLARGPEHNTMK